MAGLHAEIRTRFAQSAQNYIVASRIAQGKEDLQRSSPEEREDIEARWFANRDEMKGFYSWRQKEKGKSPSRDASPSRRPSPDPREASAESLVPREPPSTGWRHTKNLSWEERKRLQDQKKAWKKRQAAVAAAASGAHVIEDVPASRINAATGSESNDPEFELAIQAAVRETSNGDSFEDARIERAIRSSVIELRRRSTISLASTASYQSAGHSTGLASSASDTDTTTPSSHYGFPSDLKQQIPFSPEDFENITDEEYQALIEQAVQLSIAEDLRQSQRMHGLEEEDDDEDDEDYQRALERSQTETTPHAEDEKALLGAIEASQAEHALRQQQGHDGQDDEEELKKAIEASQEEYTQRPANEGDDEEELRRALEASERAHQEEQERAKAEKTEEDIILEYIKKQSLAEEQYRQKGKGKAASQDDDEEDLRKAIEESMKAAGKAGESSRSGSGAVLDSKTPEESKVSELP